METYVQLEDVLSMEICKQSDYKIKWGLEDLFKLAYRGTSEEIRYIFNNCDKLIKYCLRTPRNYEGLRSYINKRI